MHTYLHSIHHCSLGLLTLLIIFLFVYVLYLTFVWTIFWLSLPVTDASFWVWPDAFVHAVSFWVFQWFQPTSVVSYPSLVLTFCIFLALFGRISQFGGYIVSIIWWLLVAVQIPKLFFTVEFQSLVALNLKGEFPGPDPRLVYFVVLQNL